MSKRNGTKARAEFERVRKDYQDMVKRADALTREAEELRLNFGESVINGAPLDELSAKLRQVEDERDGAIATVEAMESKYEAAEIAYNKACRARIEAARGECASIRERGGRELDGFYKKIVDVLDEQLGEARQAMSDTSNLSGADKNLLVSYIGKEKRKAAEVRRATDALKRALA